MSLIDDALKRAQAAHQAERKLEGRPWTPPPMPDPRRIARSRALRAIGLVLFAAAAGAVFLPWRLSPPAKLASGPTLPTITHTGGLPPIGSEVAVAPPPQGVAPSTAMPRRDMDARTHSTDAPHPLAPSSAVAHLRSAQAPAARTEALEGRPVGPASEPRTYAGEMALPGGGKITLDGIVFSEASPVAVVNGRVLPVGGLVEGYTVARILADRVELEHEGHSVVLTLR